MALELDREVSRKIANRALPKILHKLPMHMKLELLNRGDAGNEESLLEELTAKLADEIYWAAVAIENERRERSI